MANKEFTKKWSSALIEDIVFKIKGGCIVPIIGPGVYYIEGENCGIQQFIVRELLRRNIPSKADDADIDNYVSGGFKGMTRLSRLFEQNNLELRTSLRALFYDESVMSRIKMNNQVLDFLQKGRFPLVLTTCYYKVLDSMITCDGNNYKVAAYRKEQRSVQDIQLSDADDTLTSPTIFHLFGLLDSTSKEYVVTENDFLSFLHCIQDTNHYPKRLKQYLENRFLLTLGCEIPDWTFRFLLYSLKEKNGELQKAKGAVNNFEGGAVTKAMNDDLDEFLSDIKYFSNNKVDDFLEDINSLLAPVQLPTIFLSMVHEEYESLGKKIKDALKFIRNDIQQSRRAAREGALALKDYIDIKDVNMERYKQLLAKLHDPGLDNVIKLYTDAMNIYKNIVDKYVAKFVSIMQEGNGSYYDLCKYWRDINIVINKLTDNMSMYAYSEKQAEHNKHYNDIAMDYYKDVSKYAKMIENTVNKFEEDSK